MRFLKWVFVALASIAIIYFTGFVYLKHSSEKFIENKKKINIQDFYSKVKNGDIIFFLSRRTKFLDWKPIAMFGVNDPFLHAGFVIEHQGKKYLLHFVSGKYESNETSPYWPDKSKYIYLVDLEKFLQNHFKSNKTLFRHYQAPDNNWNILDAASKLTKYKYSSSWLKMVTRTMSREDSKSKKLMHCCSFVGQCFEKLNLVDPDKVTHPFSDYMPQKIPKMLKELDYKEPDYFEIIFNDTDVKYNESENETESETESERERENEESESDSD